VSEENLRPDRPDAADSTGSPKTSARQSERVSSVIHRAQEAQRRVKTSAAETGEWLERRRQADRRVDYALTAYERDRATGGVVLSGAVAFRLFLFFVPFVVFIVLLLGVGSTSRSNQDLARHLGVGGLIAKAAGGTNHLSTWERITSLVLVAVGLFYGARALYRVLHIVFALEWSMPVPRVRSTRPGLVMIGFVAVCLGVELGLSRLREVSPVGGPIGTVVLFFFLPAAFWLAALQYLPHHSNCPWWAQIPGAFLIAMGVEAVHLFTIYWVAGQITKKSALYGGIGGSVAILLWAYVIGRLIVLGAVINSLLWERYEATPVAKASTPEASQSRRPQSDTDSL
jgi:uncharacterized BrkB/YihY/UPF0761 family membrane protein